uniref:hypothetical protein n=1 Tax=Vibrio vulnificus TaxID=672 RepID=UPI0039B63E1E
NTADKELWPALIKFSALHEVGHCVGQRDPAIRELTLKALKGSKEAVNKVESYADLFGLAMLSKYYPNEASEVQAHLIQIRSSG